MSALAELHTEGLRTLIAKEDLQLFQKRFSSLSEKQQLAMRLYCLNGLSLEDSAAIYGATERAVSDVLHRAICKLLTMYGLPAEKISLSYHRNRKAGEKK